MSKLKKFKHSAHAAFQSSTANESATALAPELETEGLAGTQRLKRARLIPVDRLTPDPAQPRKHFPEKSLQQLAASIASHGVLQPLTVSYSPAGDTFTIITGERRYRAARRAGLTQIPCIILNGLTDQERLYQQLVENLQREDISPFEEADAFRLLAERFDLKHQQIAHIVAKSRTYVTKTIGLARIPASIRRLCAQRGITSREHLILVAQRKTEPAMRAFLKKLTHQAKDVRTLRKVAASPRSRQSKTRPFEFRYQSPGFMVRVSFTKHKVSKPEIARALTKALNSLSNE